MRLTKLTLLGVMLIFLVTAMPLFAQDDDDADDMDSIELAQEFALAMDFGTTTFNYPETWTITDGMAEFGIALITNSQDFLEDVSRDLRAGEFLIAITTVPLDNLPLTIAPEEFTLEALLPIYIGEEFAPIIESRQDTFGDNEVALGEVIIGEANVRVYALRFDDIVVYVDLSTPIDEITAYTETLDAIVSSITFTTEVLTTPEETAISEATATEDVISNNDPQTIITDDSVVGYLSVDYPNGWFSTTEDGFPILSNVQVGLNPSLGFGGQPLETDEIIINVLSVPRENIGTNFAINDSSPSEFLETFLQSLVIDGVSEDEQVYVMEAVEAIELDTLNIAQSTGTYYIDDEITQDTQFIVILSDEGVVIIITIAGNDTIATYQDTIYDIVQSIEYRAP